MNFRAPPDLRELVRSHPALRRAYYVGGCVRDALLAERSGEDFDLEVYGVSYEQLADALRPHGRVDLVGRSFGVVKLLLGGATHDFSIPRRDSKTGPGHRGFQVGFDPDIRPEDASARRDFTINALMLDPRRGEILDFHGGRRDLERRVLRHTGPAFVEDPLRVLRGMQFAARFNLVADPATLSLCRSIASSYRELPGDRVREEWLKWATRSVRPSAGLRFLADSGWLAHFPPLNALQGVPQDPEWHPEGDVFQHTLHVLDALVELPEWREADAVDRAVWSFAALAHDFGKSCTTRSVERDGRPRIVSPGHEQESARLAEEFLSSIHAPRVYVERVLPLVENHMVYLAEITTRSVRRLARRLQPESIDRLCTLMTADAYGRPPRPRTPVPGIQRLRTLADELAVASTAPSPILLGRHLLALGLPAGKNLGEWTRAAFEAQLDGHFGDLPGAYRWLAEQTELPPDARRAARESATRAHE